MPICPECKKDLANTKALGSHMHYKHGKRRGRVRIRFTVDMIWTSEGQLIIECPSAAARDFMARVMEDEPIVVKVKEKGKDELQRH